MLGPANLWLLALLYLLQICISVCASLSLLVVILLLRRFDVFHVNLRTLLWHILLCLLCNNCLQVLRPLLLLIQSHHQQGGLTVGTTADNMNLCAEINALPAPFCAFICIAGVLICMERLYATFNYAKYEMEDFQFVLSKIFAFMWICTALYSAETVYFHLLPAASSGPSYLQCHVHQLQINPLKTHWHLLFALLFHGVFCLILYVVLSVNKEKQEVYVKFHYSSLSHRFQIGENVKSVRLLLKTVPQLALAIAVLFAQTVWLYLRTTAAEVPMVEANGEEKKADNIDGMELALLAESSLLVLPTFSLTMAYTIICSSNMFRNKAKMVVSQFWSQLRHSVGFRCCEKAGGGIVNGSSGQMAELLCDCGEGRANGNKSSNGNAAKAAFQEAELLREYWDDFLHIQ